MTYEVELRTEKYGSLVYTVEAVGLFGASRAAFDQADADGKPCRTLGEAQVYVKAIKPSEPQP